MNTQQQKQHQGKNPSPQHPKKTATGTTSTHPHTSSKTHHKNHSQKQGTSTTKTAKTAPSPKKSHLPPPAPCPDQPARMPLGRNMPAKLPWHDAIHHARSMGHTAIQLFLGDPDCWQAPLLPPLLAQDLAQHLADAHFSSIIVHAPFVLDFATEKETIRLQSICLLRTILYQARLIGASDVVVHLTNYKKSFLPAHDTQVQRIAQGIITSLSDGPNHPLSSIRLLLENGCDPRFSLGSSIEQLGRVLHAIPPHYPIGVCLDTAHCWCAGYDLCDHMPALVQALDQHIGLPRIHLLHLNDALHPRGTPKDTHAQWGTGQIYQRTLAGIRTLLQDPRLAHLSLILEPPLKKTDNHQFDWDDERHHQERLKHLLFAPSMGPATTSDIPSVVDRTSHRHGE